MEKHDVPVNDLFGFMKALRDQSAMAGNDVHYTEDNNSKLGEQVANQIKSMLGDESGRLSATSVTP